MGIIDSIVKKAPAASAPLADPNKLNVQELQLALQLLKQSTLKGEQVECFYNLVVKMQNQFLEQAEQ